MKKTLTIILTILSLRSTAQEIAGRAFNEKKEPLPEVSVIAYQAGIIKGSSATDIDGNYVIRPLDPGIFDVLFTATGYDSVLVTGVVAKPGERTVQHMTLTVATGKPKKTIMPYRKLLVTPPDESELPTTPITDIVTFPPVEYQRQRGGDINFAASRSSGCTYIIDVQPKVPILKEIEPTFHVPVLDNPTTFIFTRNEILKMPSQDVFDMIALLPGAHQSQRGSYLNIFGARSTGNLYILDGMQLMR